MKMTILKPGPAVPVDPDAAGVKSTAIALLASCGGHLAYDRDLILSVSAAISGSPRRNRPGVACGSEMGSGGFPGSADVAVV
jgi:hypothetical protein